MKNIYFIILVCSALFSCTSRTIYKKPTDLIPKDQMVDLWVDIMIANGADNVNNKNAQKKINYMRFIYEKYQIDSTRFMKSNVYYTSKIEAYEKMFEEVSEKIKKIKEAYAPLSDEEEITSPIVNRDSLRKAREQYE